MLEPLVLVIILVALVNWAQSFNV